MAQSEGAARLYATIEGPIRFALLDWALETGLFDFCAEGRTAKAVADARGLDAGQVALVLRALVAARFLEQSAGVFHTAPDILPFVVADGSRNLRENLRAMAGMRHAGLDDIAELLRPDRPAPERPLFDATHWDRAHGSLKAFHRAVAADAMEPCLVGLHEWTRAASLLEVGPGSAVLARRLLARRPELHITLLDLPPVADRIRVDTADLPVEVVAGSYNDTLPEGPFDIVWCSMSLYFRDNGLQRLIERLADVLNPNGVLVSFHEALHDARTGPPEHVIGRLMPSLRQGDVSFAEGEIADAMSDAGLADLETQTVTTAFGRFRLDLARKRN
ncbi:trans-aconitate 2-methyltransferase [Puniceibacterium sp. IMCC21224]|uniref:class I SAM-dependent methyltransferase n=1 Tax=Puniceibacterium sp. IMCC21224 TaxID=1618204 RepID=UPI00064E1121|nr:class I SAM-dependent methyltransferase [Puniceibacterium sp. IMCC21224]KMK64663.1 Methyltransferase domain [Puniceibacterium sp. IMCC21224]